MTTDDELSEQHFERNQYADVFLNANKSEFVYMKNKLEPLNIYDPDEIKTQEETKEDSEQNDVYYIIKDDKMYFHIDPSSHIFDPNVVGSNRGKYHIATYTTEWSSPVCNGGKYILPIVTYDINVTLTLKKGIPISNPADDDIVLPVGRLYNIFVSGNVISAIPLGNKNYFIATNQKEYRNSAYYINQDGSISILNSSGNQIAKYPSSYRIEIDNDECYVMEL